METFSLSISVRIGSRTDSLAGEGEDKVIVTDGPFNRAVKLGLISGSSNTLGGEEFNSSNKQRTHAH